MSASAAWAGRRVFLTGHTGFKGGWLAWWLHGLGARLTGYALPAQTPPSLHEVARVGEAFERQHEADVRDAVALRAAMHVARPEVVFHLAAQPLVRESYRDPLQTFSTNVMGTVNLLDAVRHCGSVRAVVVVTTDKVYREQDRAHREGDALGGHDPYSASKACAELVTDSYRAAFELPARGVGVATARAGNVYGGGDWTPERLLPDLLHAVGNGQVVRLRRPAAVRPWQHVLEPLAGYLLLAERLLQEPTGFGGAWNFGPEPRHELPVIDIAQRLLALAEADDVAVGPVEVVPPVGDDALHEAPVLRLDASRARQRLGWRCRFETDEGLRWAWQWHQAWRAGQDMREFTQRQIGAYAALNEAPE